MSAESIMLVGWSFGLTALVIVFQSISGRVLEKGRKK